MASPNAGLSEDKIGSIQSVRADILPMQNGRITPDGESPTKEESKTLQHVSDRLPGAVWLVAVVVFAERLLYFGLTSPFQNYMQYTSDNPSQPGALGLGEITATNVSYFFSFFQYVMTIPMAIVADSWLGRYRTLLAASGFYFVGIVIIFVTSLPVVLRHGGGLPGLIVGMIFVGVGVGGYKSSVSAFIGDQYSSPALVVNTRNNKRVVVDRNVTIESIYNLYYWATNLGIIALVVATLLEKHVGYWAAYIVPFGAVIPAGFVLILGKKQFITKPADGSSVLKAVKALWIGLRNGFKLDNARPSALQSNLHGTKHVDWDDHFVDELKRALIACRVFLLMPIIWLCQFQLATNLVSQAADMETSGVPNDLFRLMNSITVVVLLPIVHRYIYPFLRKINRPLRPITKITIGFMGEATAMTYAAIVQHLVYSSGPCYSHPRACPASQDGLIPNHISVFIQLPVYVIEASGEVFMATAIFEYAYTKAPKSMKSLLQAALILTAPVGNILGFAFAALYRDPRLVILYSVLAGCAGTGGVLVWTLLNKYNRMEESLNRLDDKTEAQKTTEQASRVATSKNGHVSGEEKDDGAVSSMRS